MDEQVGRLLVQPSLECWKRPGQAEDVSKCIDSSEKIGVGMALTRLTGRAVRMAFVGLKAPRAPGPSSSHLKAWALGPLTGAAWPGGALYTVTAAEDYPTLRL